MKILLIEDHDFQRHILLAQLKKIIVQDTDKVIGAASGIEALSLMDSFQPDVLICDLNMPEMDGITFLSRIAEQAFSGFIIITSATSPKVIKAVSKMCVSYDLNLLGALAKPIQLPRLAELIEHAKMKPTACRTSLEHIPPISASVIEQGFEQEWFIPYLQPIVNLKTGQWVSCEALIRLQHPTMGLIAPNQFYPLLNKLGKDTDLALYTLRYMIENQTLLQGRKVAINITPQTLSNIVFVDSVLRLAHQHTGLPEAIYFELTESDIIKDTGRALEAASRLSMHGFKLSIDDFGTGFSSLKQLETLPFESIKLDISFIRAVNVSNTASAIIESCLFLSNKLDLVAIAEGVENIQIWQRLLQLDCQLAQGFFIAVPMPINKINQWHIEWQGRLNKGILQVGL